MAFTVKRPFVWSTSGYNSPDVDVADSVIPVAAALCRATIGTPAFMNSTARATDTSFPIYWPQWDREHLPRCAYHFLKNGAGGAEQARFFASVVRAAGGIHPCDRIALDVEDGWGTYSIREIVDCFYNIHLAFPYIPFSQFLLYSRQDIMNPLSFAKLTPGEIAMLLSIRQWPAGYPDEPDLWDYAHLARGYRMDTAKYGPVALVQYAGAAVIEGLSKPQYLSIECNVADPTYLEQWQNETQSFYGAPPPVQDVISFPYPGVKVTRGRRFNSDVLVMEIAKDAIGSAIVTIPNGCKFVEQIVGDIVTNGGDFDMTTCKPIGLLHAAGLEYAPQADFEPALGFNFDHSPEITHRKTDWPDAVGLKRYIVENGAVSPNTSDAWNNREPRNIQGVKANGDLVLYQCKGRQMDQAGHTLFESAAVMIDFGAVTAADGDGGDSVQSRIKGELFTGTATRRMVADFISLSIKQSGGSPMEDKYKCVVTWDNGASVRPAPSTANTGIGVYQDGEVFFASELLADPDDPSNPQKQWAKVSSDPRNGTLYDDKYVAVKYPASSGAFERVTVEEIGAPPPPPPSGATVDYVIIHYTDGTNQRFVPG